MNLYQNIELWSQTEPRIARLLAYQEPQNVEFCESQNGQLNLKRGELHYHSPLNPLEEAKGWFSTINQKDVRVLYVYGVGLGYYYEAAKEWLHLDPHRHLVFLEDDLEVIYRLLETEGGTALLEDPQVTLHYFEELTEKSEVLDALYWNFVLARLQVSALLLYQNARQEKYIELHHKIVYDATVKDALVEEYLLYGAGFFKNFYPNMLMLPESYYGNCFFGKFNQVPAIICGAGPSLKHSLEALKGLSDRALIFAGGSALNALDAAEITPHLGAGIDPNAEQYERLNRHQGYEVPFFYRNRLFYGAFQQIHGPRLYITGSGGYDISEWFEEKFGLDTTFFDEGHNVVNFSTQIAHAMGCNPIIFVGMDLAYTDLQAYADGVLKDAQVTPQQIVETEDFDNAAFLKKDIFGKPIYTMWKWVAESDWIASFAEEHPETAFFNATEGGLGFEGIQNQSLAYIAEKYLKTRYNLKDRIFGEIQNSQMPQVTELAVREAIEEIQTSLRNCVEHLDILIQDAQELSEKIEKGHEVPHQMQSGRAALAETDLAEEPAYEYILAIFNEVYSRMLNHEVRLLKLSKENEWKKKQQVLHISMKKLTFLKDVASANLELMCMGFKEANRKAE
ncbi:motility associated factor glycosyltransferase family protein [Parachlamydia acanthamoebae]|uniref:motility associated factor glycosyltransferase family protein n=1 Tax=Parachlamydia acanthamoebae TaxID=83552 RepID=UPI000750B9CD|nr:6-hydroxymethylpterin diphosphokinase MptE-like protein [Parachlamydia acanthamoebae]